MNKNRYKLIFSQSKSCLVPVAECIKSAVGNGSSDAVSTTEGDAEEPPLEAPHALSPVSLWVKNTFNPVSSVMQLTWKHVSILLLTVVSAPAFAQPDEPPKKPSLTKIENNHEDIKLATENNIQNGTDKKTALWKTDNNVIVIDIAKPNGNKISNNIFEKFDIPNGAVFKNNKQQERSQIIGYLEKNPNLGENDVVDVILNQVKGSDESKIKGALEVLGKKADIVIANQNGITLNGVRTINADRFVVTTSKTIDPNEMLLDVTGGKVTIDVNGLATDGLKYLDIIAKTIEQKQSIVPAKELKPETEITLVAGTSKYDFNKHQVTEKNDTAVPEGTIAITGASTGAMHGKNIKLIVTDKGAGVKHDGIILSEEDIHIELHDGDLDIGNTTDKTPINTLDRRLQANKKIEVKKAKRTTIGSELKADEIKVETQDLIVKANTEVRAKTADIKSKDTVSFEDSAKLVATKVDVKTEALTNKGVLYGSDVKLDANDLVNEKEIFAETKLDIETKGKEFSISETDYKTVRLLKNAASLKPGFLNKGVIESKGDATLTFKDNTSFLAQDNRFIKAGKNLTITAQNVEIEKQDIQLSSNLTINVEESFINREGTLASAQTLKITAKNGGIYNVGATLGAAKELSLKANSNDHKKGNIVNREGSLLHTLGTLTLDTNRAVYNIGSIYAKDKITVKAHELINDVSLSGDIRYKTLGSSRLYEMSEVAAHGWHNNVYKLNLDIQELDKADIKVKNRGAIRSDGDFYFKGIAFENGLTTDDLQSKLINHGLINVKGTFKAEVDQVTNQMKYYERDALSSVFKNKASIKIHYQPLARFIWTALSGNTVREFDSLESFLDAMFGPSPIATTSLYSAENYSAYQILRHVQHSDMYQKAMAQVFGAEWHTKSYDTMKADWKKFKDNPTSLKYYPAEKARILADKLEGNFSTLQNGEHTEYGKFDGAIKIGQHELTLPKIEFKPEIANGQDLNAEDIDFKTIAELLETPNLFIDYSVQFEKKYVEDDEYFIPPVLQNSDSLSSLNNDEYKTRSRTTLDPDYDNPDEFFENGHFFNELLIELSKEHPEALQHLVTYPNGDYFDYKKNLARYQNLGEGHLQDPLRRLFDKKKAEHDAMRAESSKKALVMTEQKEEKRIIESKKEEKRQALDKVEKIRQIKEEKRKVEEIRQKEKQLEIAIKQQEVKEQQEKAVAEAKQKAEQQRKVEQKAAQEKLEVQQAQAYQESVKHETVVSKDTFLKVIDDHRPKVETDPLYRTKLKYINQDQYAGANYFFNKLGLDTQGNQKINVLGDNYFDHQLITRTIEKKADNRLNQKYNLTDVELVKKLMENSTSQAKALDLKIGAGLTKEQQSKLTEDIVWYVKTRVNGKDVFVPQVYLAPETVAENKKLQGLGTGVISAREVDIKADNVTNTGTLAGNKVKVEATNKIQNKGSILSTEETRLVGHKGIENLSRSFANNELGVETQRSEIRTEGHLHLETDKNASVDIQASDVKAKSAFVKTGDLNVKNTYNTKHSYQESIQGPSVNIGLDLRTFTPIFDVTAGSRSEQKSEATSVGSKIAVDQLHLAVENDVNQVGSDIEAKRISGVVKGNYNTEAGKNIKHEEHEEYGSQTYLSAHASGGGTSVRYDYNSKEGGKASHNVPTSQTGLGADAGVSFTYEQEKETLLTHTNSELQVESGKLHVLGQADIGGVDINTRVPEKPQNKAALPESAAQTAEANPAEKPAEAAANPAAASQPNGAPVFNTLSDAEIADLMSEKTKEHFEQEAKKAPTSEGFELAAKEIKSTKQKDQYDQESVRTSFKIGPEAEAHSAIADMVSHVVKEFRDAQNGIKRDGTAVLQNASDALNIITGDLAGTSTKLAVERNHETKRTSESGDILTKIGGNVTLSAHGGSVELKNVQSDENTNLTLRAKDDVNILAGEKNREVDETVSRQKLAAGVNAGCGMMNGACTAGGSASLEGNESYTSERQTSHNNSLLQGQNIKIEAGRDLNLVSSNIDANNVDLNVQGKTNIVSKQDTLQKTTHGFDYNLSLGVALSSATIATPTGNIGAGYTNETETSRTVNQQAGIKANKLTGQVKDVNLEGGYLISQDGSNSLKVTGDVTSKALQDQHDKDGGSFGLSVGISERGTTAFNIRGGRSDQKHYNATQQSTISGIDTSKAQVSGPVNTDLSKAKEVTRDDTYASTQFSFEVADIIELGQRAKNNLQSKLGGVPDNTPDVPTNKVRATEEVEAPQTRSRLADEVDVAAQKARTFDTESESASVKNPIYESAESVATPRRSAGETEVSEVSPKVRLADSDAESVSVKNPVYDSIETAGATPRTRNGDATETLENPLYTPLTPRAKANDDDGATAKTRVYEEIPLTDDGASQALSSPRSKVATEEHTYEEVAQGPYSTVGDKNANGGRGPKVNSAAEGIYSTIEEVNVGTARRGSSVPEYSELQAPSRRQATDPLPDVPNAPRPRLDAEASDGIYAEIALKPRNAHDPLPELPPEARIRSSEAPDFAEHIYESLPLAKRPLPNTPDAETKVTVSGSESEYASVNVTPRTRNPQDTLPETPNARPRSIADSDGIYSEAENITTLQPRTKSSQGGSDYEQIPLDAIDSDGAVQPRSNVKRGTSEETNSLEAKVRHAAEESPESVVNAKAKGTTNDELYATLDKTTEGRARANAKADEAIAQNAVAKVRVEEEAAPALPKRPDNLTSDAESSVPASTAKVARQDNDANETPSVRSRTDDPDYTTVADVVPTPRAKGDRPLPETPDAQSATQARNRIHVEGDYAEVLDTVAKPKANAGRELPEVPNQALPKARLSSVDGDYAEIGQVPAAKPRAQNEQTVAEPQSVVAAANTNNNSNRAKPVDVKDSATEVPAAAAKAEKSEKSWLTKVKDFFTGSSSKEQAKAKASKAAKAAEQDAQVAAKPRYDDLEDNINLKNLLALEEQRNESFESNVLKNAKFLDEAREA
ncbi:two-partner secretion domain-containing protein, partial [Pasteurella sp. P03HT]